jgi:hypothetical protein
MWYTLAGCDREFQQIVLVGVMKGQNFLRLSLEELSYIIYMQ